MQPNTMAAPRQLMHDVTPPYNTAVGSRPTPAIPTAQEAVTTPTIAAAQPVQATGVPAPAEQSLPSQPITTPQPQPSVIPVHEQATPPIEQPAASSVPTNHQTQPAPAKEVSLTQPKVKANWLIIILALAVSAGLAVTAYLAYKPH